ncbi:hypothetical protein PVAP13_6KG260500 [Panicum virgatum]|uniref:Uncharacterized protein n=1 Tax=Panicum virgatum TaxID=38727 RepID=A0A8T0RC96_PANVG|nr:hypothetical protein PVAP13_6KG260500 [Panicum virgatum]
MFSFFASPRVPKSRPPSSSSPVPRAPQSPAPPSPRPGRRTCLRRPPPRAPDAAPSPSPCRRPWLRHPPPQWPALAALEHGQASGRPVAAPSAGNRRARRVLAAEHAAPQQAWASNGTQPKASSSLGVLRPGRRCEQEQVGSSSWANSV